MSGFYIEIEKADLKNIQKKFGDAPQNAKRVLRNSINQTATLALRKIKQGRSAGYTIKAGSFNSEIQVQRANFDHLDATIKSQGKPRTLKEFKNTVKKADITKTGLKALVNSAGAKPFIGPGGRISGLIVQRTTRERYPLRVLHSNSVPMMVDKIFKGERGGQGDMQPFIEKTLHDKVMEQASKII